MFPVLHPAAEFEMSADMVAPFFPCCVECGAEAATPGRPFLQILSDRICMGTGSASMGVSMVLVEIFCEPVDLVAVGTRELLPSLMGPLLVANPVEFEFEPLATRRT